MGVGSQFENKPCLLSHKDMLMGREQRTHKRNQVKVANGKQNDREESTSVSLPHGFEEKSMFQGQDKQPWQMKF